MDPRKKLARKEILRMARFAGDIGSTAELCTRMLAEAGIETSLSEVLGHLEYLAGPGKEYVTLHRHEITGLGERTIVKLLPKGVDLLEKNIPADPGVA